MTKNLIAKVREVNGEVKLGLTSKTKAFLDFAEFLGFTRQGKLDLDDVKTLADYRKKVEDYITEEPKYGTDSKRKLSLKAQGKALVISTPAPIVPKKIRRLPVFERGDGAHWGVAEWYDDKKYALKRAILGKSDWTTGWYASKKEIVTAKITRERGVYTVEVGVSDDFDTEGVGFRQFKTKKATVDAILKRITKELYEAWNEAKVNQKNNRQYRGFSVLKDGRWIETYIQNVSEWGLDSPPGDNYHKWGFQGESRIPKEIKEKLEDWVLDLVLDLTSEPEFTYKGYTIQAWKDESPTHG